MNKSVFLVRPAWGSGAASTPSCRREWRETGVFLVPSCHRPRGVAAGPGQKRRLRRDRSHAQAGLGRASMARTHLLARAVAAPHTARMTARPGFRNVPTPWRPLGRQGVGRGGNTRSWGRSRTVPVARCLRSSRVRAQASAGAWIVARRVKDATGGLMSAANRARPLRQQGGTPSALAVKPCRPAA